MKPEIIIGMVGAVSTIIAALLPHFIESRRSKRIQYTQLYKFVFVKVYHLRNKTENPVYQKTIQRLGTQIPVWDEIHYFRQNIFRKEQDEFTCTDRSSGAVDVQILHPFKRLVFADKNAEKTPDFISQTIKEKSSIFFTRAIYYNGFQKDNEDLGTIMEAATEEARLLIDFSSLPNLDKLFNDEPKAFLVTCDGAERQISYEKPLQGMYSVSQRSLGKGDVLRFDFSLNRATLVEPAVLPSHI